MTNITVTPEIKQAMDIIKNTKKNLIISGKAGTGKSTFLKYFLEECYDKKAVLLAPTGIAAVNIGGGTIHKFFGLGIGVQNIDDDKYFQKRIKPLKKILRETDFIIIDEISMVRADIFDAIMYILYRSENPNIRVICLGDMMQLKPIVTKNEEEVYNSIYKDVDFKSSRLYWKDDWETVEFETIFRQNDPVLKQNLNNIREGLDIDETLGYFNKRVGEHKEGNIIICNYNAQAQEINSTRLRDVQGKEFVFWATVEDFPSNSFPTDERLVLKVGAKVMCVKNDPMGEYVNGTIGTITEISNDYVFIKKEDDGEVIGVAKQKWSAIEYELVDGKFKKSEKGSFTQFPLKIAYAITVHKSQGKTFSNVTIDRGRGFFAEGQLYVALSRCKTYEGITLTEPLKRWDVK